MFDTTLKNRRVTYRDGMLKSQYYRYDNLNNKYNRVLKDHEFLNREVQKLKSQMYEVCRRTSAGDSVCARIKSNDYTPTAITSTTKLTTADYISPLIDTNKTNAIFTNGNRSEEALLSNGRVIKMESID